MSWEDDDYTPSVPTAELPIAELTDKTLEALVRGGEEAAAPAGAPAAPLTLKPKHLEKAKMREREERAERERAEMLAARGGGDAPLADPAAERRRLEALQLRADMAIAADSLGAGGKADLDSLVGALTVVDGAGFAKLGKAVAERVHELAGARGTALAMRFYAEVIAVAGERTGVDELKALEACISVARNKKLAAAKAAAGGGKKKTGVKVHLGGDYDGAAPVAASRGIMGARRAPRALTPPPPPRFPPRLRRLRRDVRRQGARGVGDGGQCGQRRGLARGRGAHGRRGAARGRRRRLCAHAPRGGGVLHVVVNAFYSKITRPRRRPRRRRARRRARHRRRARRCATRRRGGARRARRAAAAARPAARAPP